MNDIKIYLKIDAIVDYLTPPSSKQEEVLRNLTCNIVKKLGRELEAQTLLKLEEKIHQLGKINNE